MKDADGPYAVTVIPENSADVHVFYFDGAREVLTRAANRYIDGVEENFQSRVSVRPDVERRLMQSLESNPAFYSVIRDALSGDLTPEDLFQIRMIL